MYTLIIDEKKIEFSFEESYYIDGEELDVEALEETDPLAALHAARDGGRQVEVEGRALASIEGSEPFVAKTVRWPFQPGESRDDHILTVIEAAELVGIEIPHFCYHPGLSSPANCRMCLVEIVGGPKLQPACYSKVTPPPWLPPKMTVNTANERVIRARKAVLEFILLNHPVDCPICDQAGECKLQDYYFKYSAQSSRLNTQKVNKVKVFPIGPEIVYDGERCILCTRCVRFCQEITETHELTTVQRADMAEIRTFPGMELDNDYSLCTVDLCPVGALTDRDFRFKCRVWYLETTSSICTGCARGCNIHLEHFKDEVQRYRPRANPDVNKWWMCDHGRRSYRAIHEDRMLTPVTTIVGQRKAVPIQRAVGSATRRLRTFLEREGGARLGVVLSPQATCEELFALLAFAKAAGVERFYVSGRPDDAFTLRRDPTKVSDDFLIHQDKNPNRAGLLRLAEAFGVTLRPASALVDEINTDDINASPVQGLYVSRGTFPFEITADSDFIKALKKLELLLYVGQRHSPIGAIADLALPVCSHAEQEGTFINVTGHRQHFARAFEPHGQSLPEWGWLAQVAKRLGFASVPSEQRALHRATAEMLASAPAPASEAASPLPEEGTAEAPAG